MSAGSYGMFDGGGRDDSDEVRDGEYDLAGEDLLGIYGRYDGASAVGRGMFGTLSSIEGDCGLGRDVVEEWCDCWEEPGLGGPIGELCFLKFTRTVI